MHHRFALFAILTSLVAGNLIAGNTADAQDRARLAITRLDDVDADFAWQGEYAGGGWGLQVVPQGDGAFQGMLHYGGLPGNGWNRVHRWQLTGKQAEGAVALADNSYRATIQPYQVDLFNSSGQWLARLTKVQRTSRTLGMPAPPWAEVLFDGSSAEKFQNGRITDEGLLQIGTMTREPVGDFQLHLEFQTPYMPYARGQGRANSGVYIQQRYEVQILDSFGLQGVENECAAMYRQKAPLQNMAFPPLAWQTYDIWFRQARWSEDGKTRVEPARITVLHNGVAVHWNYELTNKTGGGKPEGPEEFPIALQDHGNPVVFRNIWIVHGNGVYPQYRAAPQPVYCAPPRLPGRTGLPTRPMRRR